MMKGVVGLLLGFFASWAVAQATQTGANMEMQALAFVEGKQYTLIQPTPEAPAMEDPMAQALLQNVPKHKVAVWQFFSYGCPVCNRLEPYVEKWHEEKKSQELVAFTDIPVAWAHPGWNEYARAFYIEQSLSQAKNKRYVEVMKQGHQKIFAAIHQKGTDLTTKDNMRAFFHAELGVQPTDFDTAYTSFNVGRRVSQAEHLTKAYNIRALPSFVVAGKYYVDIKTAGGVEQLIAVVNYLVNKETFTAETGKIDFDAVSAE